MRARLRRAIRRCDGVRRLAPATAVGVGGRRSCRCGGAGQRGSRPHWAAPHRGFLSSARNSVRSRLADTGGGVCAPVAGLASKPMRTDRLPTADAPVAPCRCTRRGPARCRCTVFAGRGADLGWCEWGGVQPGRQAARHRRQRRHGAVVGSAHRPSRRRAPPGHRSYHVMLVGLPHGGAPLTGNACPGKHRPDDGTASSTFETGTCPVPLCLPACPAAHAAPLLLPALSSWRTG